MKGKQEDEFVYIPFCRETYNLHRKFTTEEAEALSTSHKRSRLYSRCGPLSSLITPLMDIASNGGTGHRLTRLVIMAMLAEMADSGQPSWQWNESKWVTLFEKYRSGKPLLMAFAFHLGPFASPLQLPHEGTFSLYASTIYGSTMFSRQLSRLSETLISLGYAQQNQRNAISSPLGLLMLLNIILAWKI